MAALEHLLTHSRRHFLIPTIPHRSPFLGFQRFFSSSSPDPSNQETLNPQPPQIKPVSYSLKPKPQEQSPPETLNPPSNDTTVPPTIELLPGRELRGQRLSPGPPGNDNTAAGRDWTREDFRYVKQGPPGISPVSYPVRVAPLPDDKVVSADVGGGGGEEEKKVVPVRMRRILRVEDEKVLPFPSVIKVEKKKSKVILDLQEAIREVKANAKAKFDETIEAHVNLGVDPRRGDQMVRGAATLPHGTGKAIRIAVFAEGAAAEEAREAGADVIGGDELIEEIKKGGGKLNFDKCIATPLYMPRLGKIARILGPRGLMPNPKLGSVTSDVAAAVKAAKRGRIDFKIDKTAIVHVGIGKVSFTEDSLRENIGAFVNALLIAKPVGLKKTSKYAGYVNSFSLSSTMGPGFPVSIQSLSMAADHYNKLQLK